RISLILWSWKGNNSQATTSAGSTAPSSSKEASSCSYDSKWTSHSSQRKTFEAEAQAVPQQAKMQAAVAAGPLSTGGVLLRLINTMIDTKMTMEFNETIFIISSCQLTRNLEIRPKQPAVQAAQPPPAPSKHPEAAKIPSGPVTLPIGRPVN
ncbi:putative skeletal organic matrix protein 4, partial [Acropora cervicornis]